MDCFILCLTLLYGICVFLARNHLILNKYDYLEVLSYSKWKSAEEVRKEMEELRDGLLNLGDVFAAMEALQNERLVERRMIQDDTEEQQLQIVHEFRLTGEGHARKIKGKKEIWVAPWKAVRV